MGIWDIHTICLSRVHIIIVSRRFRLDRHFLRLTNNKLFTYYMRYK